MKKIVIFIITFFIFALTISIKPVYADTCDLECNGEGATRATCNACKEKAAKDEIARLNAEIEKASKNRDDAIALANEYAGRIEVLTAEIEALQPEIDALQIRIDELVANIEVNEGKVEEINKRVLKRMENSQSSMHFNPLLDFLLGSTGFSDFLRRTYGLDAITGKEGEDKDELIRIINQLNIDKDECDKAKYELDTKKKEIESKKQDAAIMQDFYNKQKAEIDAEILKLKQESLNQQAILDAIVWQLEDLYAMPRQTGFIHPVANSRISAGLYDGRGHIGIDYAASYDTPLLAPADGVITNSINTCSLDTGNHLGNRCPENPAGQGMSAGGNQVRMIVSVNGNIYGLLFFHLRQNGVHAKGVVTAGTQIGLVGSSGNSTGAHCHIELFYLGPGEAKDIPTYLNKGYTIGFNLAYTTGTLCVNKGGAPCRLDGRLHFGYDPVSVNMGVK